MNGYEKRLLERVIAAEQRAEAAERRADELAAHVEDVRRVYRQAGCGASDEERSARLVRVGEELNKSPVASLAAHNAWLLRKCADAFERSCSNKEDCIRTLRMNADHIERGES